MPLSTHLYVYRLEWIGPPGSAEPGWQPEDWSEICKRHGYGHSYGTEHEWTPPFRWPARRNFLSSDSAARRANLLREFGATVKILVGKVEWTGEWPGA